MPVRQDFTIDIGTTPRPIVVTVTDSVGDPYNLTGCTVEALLKDRKGVVVLDLAPVIQDALGGIIAITITDETTATLTPQSYLNWDLILELDDSRVLPPIVAGNVSIIETITLS